MYHRPLRIAPLIGLALVWLGGCAPSNEYQPPPPPTVTVATPVRQDVTTYLEETGTTEPVEMVAIRARVSGYLEKINFEAGANVKAGDVLYVIQPDEYDAKVASAEAEVASNQARLKLAEIEQTRQRNLFAEKATSETKKDQAEADFLVAKAALQSAEAALKRAVLDQSYTEVTSPIDGRVGKTLVKLGNLVGETDATQLTTVVSYDPIYVNFNINERALLQATAMRREDAADQPNAGTASGEPPDLTDTKAYMRRAVDQGFPFAGHLEYADLGVDQSTGTFMIRAIFPNPEMNIFPGLFVRIRVPMGVRENAVLLPERCLGADQAGRYVMLVGENNTVERRNIQVGAKYEDLIVITEGLTGDESVVIDGIQRARPGAEVTPKTTELSPVKGDLEIIEEGSHSPIDDETAVPTPAPAGGGEGKADGVTEPDAAAAGKPANGPPSEDTPPASSAATPPGGSAPSGE